MVQSSARSVKYIATGIDNLMALIAIRWSRTLPYLDLIWRQRRRPFLYSAPPLPVCVSVRSVVPHETVQTAIGQQPTHVAGEIGQASFAAITTMEFVLRHCAMYSLLLTSRLLRPQRSPFSRVGNAL